MIQLAQSPDNLVQVKYEVTLTGSKNLIQQIQLAKKKNSNKYNKYEIISFFVLVYNFGHIYCIKKLRNFNFKQKYLPLSSKTTLIILELVS
jgi:hypothetical protein